MNDIFARLTVAAPPPSPSRSSLWIALGVLIVMLTTGLLASVSIGQYNTLRSNEARVAETLAQFQNAQLNADENHLALARQHYLDSLSDYNLGLRRFPARLIAQRTGMQPKQPVNLRAAPARNGVL